MKQGSSVMHLLDFFLGHRPIVLISIPSFFRYHAQVWNSRPGPSASSQRIKEGSSIMRIRCFFLGSLGLLAFLTPAMAEDCTAPCAGYEISMELQNDWIFATDPSSLTSDVLQPLITSEYFVAPTDYLKLVASIVTEPVVDPVPGENAIFEGVGTYVGELYAEIEIEPVTLRAGKFDPIFSLASEVEPGINATELASVFDTDERLGAELTLGFEGLGLKHAIAATAFTTDRTVLSESLFTNRGRAELSDGGVGNTNGLSSFSIALSGCDGAETSDCYEEGDFGYRIGFRHQEAGLPTQEQIDDGVTPSDEQAFLAAASKSFELDQNTLRLLAEAAYLHNFEGGPDDAMFLTASAAYDVGQMRYIATYTHQSNIIAGEPDTQEQLADFEVIYSSGDDTPFDGAKWSLGAAYTYARSDEPQDSHMLSLRATLDFGGNVEFGK